MKIALKWQLTKTGGLILAVSSTVNCFIAMLPFETHLSNDTVTSFFADLASQQASVNKNNEILSYTPIGTYASCVSRAVGVQPTCQFTGNPRGTLSIGGYTDPGMRNLGFKYISESAQTLVQSEVDLRIFFAVGVVVPCSVRTIPHYRKLSDGQCSAVNFCAS